VNYIKNGEASVAMGHATQSTRRFQKKGKLGGGRREGNKYTKPTAWYISFVNEYYIGPEQCSLVWVFKEKIHYHSR
jgi:hypothetical protein